MANVNIHKNCSHAEFTAMLTNVNDPSRKIYDNINFDLSILSLRHVVMEGDEVQHLINNCYSVILRSWESLGRRLAYKQVYG